MQWLAETPLGVVVAMSKMMGRLNAEELLARVSSGAIASRASQSEQVRWMDEQMRAWRELAEVEEVRRVVSPLELGSAGIGFRKVVRGG